MKRSLFALFLAVSLVASAHSQWEAQALRILGQLGIKALETCVAFLVTEGGKACFDKAGKPDLSALDARLRTIEAVVGVNAGPLKEVRANIDQTTTPDEYVRRVEGALLTIDQALQKNRSEIPKLEERITILESGLQKLGARVSSVETDIHELKTLVAQIQRGKTSKSIFVDRRAAMQYYDDALDHQLAGLAEAFSRSVEQRDPSIAKVHHSDVYPSSMGEPLLGFTAELTRAVVNQKAEFKIKVGNAIDERVALREEETYSFRFEGYSYEFSWKYDSRKNIVGWLRNT